ncbi:MAG: ATP-binding cassette domain-containing protein [Methanomicrobiales archaeon]|nr:ATP-binding cassette domain-containing protein [Methanomicrobiales archaeon]
MVRSNQASEMGCTKRLRAGEEIIHIDCASHMYPDGTLGMHRMCFQVLKNEIVAICGPNGAGKSTLVEHLNGTLTPYEGRIVVGGKELTDTESGELWREVGVVFQNPDDQLFAPTVLDDVMFGPLNLGMTREEARNAALDALRSLGVSELERKLPAHLSWGQKRLVSIAGIMAMKPRIIVLDEPTSGLDPVNSRRIEDLIVRMRAEHGMSVVVATHDLELAARISDRIYLIREGSVLAEGSPVEILYDTELLGKASLCAPPLVRMFLDYCRRTGVEPKRRPLRGEEFIDMLVDREKAGDIDRDLYFGKIPNYVTGDRISET